MALPAGVVLVERRVLERVEGLEPEVLRQLLELREPEPGAP